MKVQELRGKSKPELDALAKELYNARFRQRLQKVTGQMKQTHLIKASRKDLARVLTIAKETEKT